MVLLLIMISFQDKFQVFKDFHIVTGVWMIDKLFYLKTFGAWKQHIK